MAYSIAGTGKWVRTEAVSPSDGSSGGCDECGHALEDERGRYLLDFWHDVESASLILCARCYEAARLLLALEEAEKILDKACTSDEWLNQNGPVGKALSVIHGEIIRAQIEAQPPEER